MKSQDYLKDEYHHGRHWGLEDRTKVVLDYFNKYVDKKDSIIELGCSEGRNIVALQKEGYEDVEGLEMSNEAVRNIDGFKVYHERYEEFDSKEYDVAFSASFLQEFDGWFPAVDKFKETLSKTRKYFFIFGDKIDEEKLKLSMEGFEMVEHESIVPFTSPVIVLKRK